MINHGAIKHITNVKRLSATPPKVRKRLQLVQNSIDRTIMLSVS